MANEKIWIILEHTVLTIHSEKFTNKLNCVFIRWGDHLLDLIWRQWVPLHWHRFCSMYNQETNTIYGIPLRWTCQKVVMAQSQPRHFMAMVCLRVRVWCGCVCVWEREREREWVGERERGVCHMSIVVFKHCSRNHSPLVRVCFDGPGACMFRTGVWLPCHLHPLRIHGWGMQPVAVTALQHLHRVTVTKKKVPSCGDHRRWNQRKCPLSSDYELEPL